MVKARTNQTKDLSLFSRGKKAKGCDLFLSLHSNAVGSGVKESVDYPVAYVLRPTPIPISTINPPKSASDWQKRSRRS